MMSRSDIEIVRELTPAQRRQAARICFDAFAAKFRVFMLFEDDPQKGAAALCDCLNFEACFFALQGGKAVGLIGLDHGKTRFKHFSMRNLKRHYGLFGACWRVIFDKLYIHRIRPDELHIDSIAVSSDARGKGVGSLLIDAAFSHGCALGLKKATLEVVDTNPRAQALYERIGFAVTKTKRYGFLTRSAGFEAAAHMAKPL